ncbi:MAG: ABC-2 transporter permease [Paludibacteraceae bacterium]|nr:ABC-2 transporter permease [Paludibacteraceae bacterium]
MFFKELRYYFSTPIAYIVIGLYLLAISLFLWVIPGQWNIIDSGYAQVDGLFQLSPWLFMLLCPALTMRLFSEERQSGIWDLIRTKPISLSRIVLSKYFAALTLVLIGLLPCFIHYFVVAYLAEPVGNLDSGAFLGSFLGLILLSSTFMAVGILCATFSKSQIVCFITSALACFVLYWTMMQEHYASISRGVLDMRDLVFFATIIVVCIVATILTIDKLTRK